MTGLPFACSHSIGDIESAKRATRGLGLEWHLQKQLLKITTRPGWQGVLILPHPSSRNPRIAVEVIVLVLHVWLDMLLCVSIQRCSPMEEACALTILYRDLWITTAIDNSDGILIGLCPICHEAFEVGILHIVLSDEIVEFSPYDTLDLRVLRLHVTYGNGHDLAIRCIVHVTHHSGPLLDMLDMVKHEPCILEISSWLHALDEVHTTSRSVFQHLEDVHLVLALTWKDVAVDVLNCGVRFHSHDAVICSLLAAASIE
jgi:hypothetical protein